MGPGLNVGFMPMGVKRNMDEDNVLVKVKSLKKYFPVKMPFLASLFTKERKAVHAVDDVSFEIKRGETLGLVGESGSGKTTIGRLILRLIESTSGKIIFEGRDITHLEGESLRKLRPKMQVIFQDPLASLNPYMRVGEAIKHPLEIHNIGKKQERKEKVLDALEQVRLIPPEDFYPRYPRELSGGQRQRIVMARALILNPSFMVADEATAMIDVSVRSQLLKLMKDLKAKFNLTYLFITHDLASAKYICDDIAVMYLGKLVEVAPMRTIYTSPSHPYTKALMDAIPIPDPKQKRDRLILKGEIPTPIDPPSGCRFHPRCPYAKKVCSEREPEMKEIEKGHYIACHMF